MSWTLSKPTTPAVYACNLQTGGQIVELSIQFELESKLPFAAQILVRQKLYSIIISWIFYPQ